MYHHKIIFFALSNRASFTITSSEQEVADQGLMELLDSFAIIDEINGNTVVPLLQKNNKYIRQRVDKYVSNYGSSGRPVKAGGPVKAISAFFRSLNEEEYFCILVDTELTQDLGVELYAQLRALNNGISYEELSKRISEELGDVLNQYSINEYGRKRCHIGEPERTLRICRFCPSPKQHSTFQQKAHAISEALGNKNLFLCEECDQCNGDFGKTIEPDIIQYLSFWRTWYNIKGKNIKGKGGCKSFVGDGFKLGQKGEMMVLTTYNHNIFDAYNENQKSFKLPVKTRQTSVPQNIYKALCKYFVSVIASDQIPFFENTIKWINGDIRSTRLPLIATVQSSEFFSAQPLLTTYLRKVNNNKIPFAVGEFQFANKKIVFIVPFTNKDKLKFINRKAYNHFWETFKHFKKFNGWTFLNLSSEKKKKMNIPIVIDVEKVNPNANQ